MTAKILWWHNGPVGGISVPVHSGGGALIQAATVESADEIVRLLNQSANTIEQRTDTLKRIATEYPSAVEMCQCPEKPGFACPKCEIAFLLKGIL